MPPLDYTLSSSSKGIHALGPMLPRAMSREDSVDYGSWHKEELPLSKALSHRPPPPSKDFSFSKEFSFGFDFTDNDNNPVFDKIIKPSLQGKQPDTAYLNHEDQQLLAEPSSADNSLLAPQMAKRSRQSARDENLVNGLSRWDSVSSINSNDSFFLEGNCHPENTHDISTILEEEREADTMSDSGDTERDSDEMSDFDDDSRTEVGSGHSREETPVAFSFSNVELKKEAWGSDTEGETTVEELEDREKTQTFSSHSDILDKPCSYYVEPPYIKTRSGQTPAKRTKFRIPTKRRTQARAHSAKPYEKPYEKHS